MATPFTSFDYLLLNTPSFDIMRVLTDLASEFARFIPNILGALLVLILGWVLSRLLARLAKKVLAGAGIDKLAERLNDIDIISKAKIRIVPSELMGKAVYYILMLLFTVAATDILGMPAVSELMTGLINYLPNLLTAALLLFVGILLADFVKGIVLTTARSLGIPSAAIIANFVFYFLFLAVAMSALGQAKINTDFLRNNLTVIIGGGVLAFAFGYGLASRDMMANFIASFYSKNKVRPGDVVRIGGVEGEVIAIDNTSLTLLTQTNKVIIPLSKLTSENVEIIQEWEAAPDEEEPED